MIDLLWKSVVLGIIEGITEFLPISSTGHLILADQFLYFAEGPFAKMFTVVVQLGAILAVVICFREKLIPAALELIQDDERLKELHTNILTLAQPDSARRIAEEVIKLARQKNA